MYTCQRCEEIPFYKIGLGHDGPPQGMWDKNLVTGEPLHRCPIRDFILAKPEEREEVERYKMVYFPNYQKGHLLVDGGVSEQPARYIEVMTYLESLKERMEARYREIRNAQAS